MFMVFEEMGELQSELSRLRRGRSDKELVAEEIADVLIMVHQMALVCGTGCHRTVGMVSGIASEDCYRLF
jgi:NTP pyrophosphatase (non-canonical NTP hydrolase)